MRAPPPVEFACAPGRVGRAALSALVGSAAAVLVAWGLPYVAAQWNNPPDVPALFQGGLAVAVAVMTSGASWQMLRRFDGGGRTLRWDGQDWVLVSADGRPDLRGDAALMLDLGPWMLVRFAPAAPGRARAGRWLGLTINRDAARWAGLRGALWNWRAGREDGRR
jgi:hypothetical protein